MGFRRSNGGDDPFADPGKDGFFAGPAHESFDIGANRHPGEGFELDAVFGHGRNQWGFNDFGVNAHLHGFQHIPAGKIDGRRTVEVEFDIGFICRNQGLDNP
jgi:hypothetical protein